jgi:hypothetical protein
VVPLGLLSRSFFLAIRSKNDRVKVSNSTFYLYPLIPGGFIASAGLSKNSAGFGMKK